MIDPAWERARNLLAVRLDNLGDVLVTTPALHAIRRSLPQASLTLLASPVGAQAGRLNPDIDEVIVYQAPWMDPWRELPQESAREQRMIATLKARAFDGAIIFSSYHQSPLPSAYLCYLAEIPLRLAASIDGPGSLLTTRHKHPERMMHEVERGLDLVGAIGFSTDERDLVLAVPDEAAERLRRRLAGVRRPLVVLHPGCSMPARTYPWERYAAVADLLIERLGATIALTGVGSERELVARVRGRMRHGAETLDFSGALDFPEFCALVAQADLTITNNTGPMHVAAALKTPVVALFALTNPPEQWGPWHVPHRLLYHDVPCRLCYNRVCPYGQECLTLVTPEMVIEAAAELLGEALTPGRKAPTPSPSPDGALRERGEVANDHGERRPISQQTNTVILSAAEGSVLSQYPTLSMGNSPLPRIGRGAGGEGPYLRARNILAVRLDNLGDVVMLGPALRAVKETAPEARLTLLASPGGAPAAALLPWVDDVITWRALWQDLGHLPFDPARERELIARLAAGAFDAALIFTSFSQTPQVPGYVCYLAGIPLRAGESAEFGGRSLSDELRGLTPEGAHQVERNLRLVEALGFSVRDRRLAIAIPEAARESAGRLLAGTGLDPARPFVVLHPGASAAARRYPPERYGMVARELQRQGWPVLICGVEREAALLEAARAEAPEAAFLAARTTLPEYAALVARAALVVCNNSLPLHLADATGTPLVVLYSGTDRESEWEPRAVPARLLRRPTACAPCRLFECPIGLPCLDIPPREVAEAALALLEPAVARVGAV